MRHPGWFVMLGGAILLLAGCGGTSGPSSLSGRACLARLSAQEVLYRSVDSVRAVDSRCQVDTAVRVSRVDAGLNHPALMSCGLASRLDDFAREVMEPLAREELGRRVVRINHLGSYSCRGINGGSHLSQHALGRAIDIAGFRLSDGSTVSVEHDWNEPGPKRLFLRHLARRACGYFAVVLTPDSNAEHYNHIHLDIGPDRLCSV
ncbi:MAG TPA: extensin family protein [Stellaceae bacterium]|nr:extensin family protein [Stellaceae bacterium]